MLKRNVVLNIWRGTTVQQYGRHLCHSRPIPSERDQVLMLLLWVPQVAQALGMLTPMGLFASSPLVMLSVCLRQLMPSLSRLDYQAFSELR